MTWPRIAANLPKNLTFYKSGCGLYQQAIPTGVVGGKILPTYHIGETLGYKIKPICLKIH